MTEKILSTLKQDLASLKLIPSKGGCFEVFVDGERIYSKLETGEFPDEQEMLNQIVRRVR
ncbi:MAG: SelT/SelW/SelH family protein [Acidobacteria bacterium]|nr:MAG: SelT/SelW/SelH family protein [Acidobacteriota bacterium]